MAEIKFGLRIINAFIDARATVSDFGESEIIQKYFPEMKNFIRLFGSLPIRNRATIGGNIINASPIGDMTSILLPLNSTSSSCKMVKQ